MSFAGPLRTLCNDLAQHRILKNPEGTKSERTPRPFRKEGRVRFIAPAKHPPKKRWSMK